MKHFLTNTQVLKIEDLDKEFVVCTNACKEGLGGFMMQEGKVVCCDLMKLNEYKWNYVTHDLELGDIVHALKM